MRLRRERSSGPLRGYKLAYPMLSADRTKAGFGGIALGSSTVYEAAADAVCAQRARHRCPSRLCDCGFYCLHTMESAQALGCDPQYRSAVLLTVDVLGKYIRYERGLRYSRQCVRAVHVTPCRCGSPAEVFADTGHGSVGWHRLEGVCVLCVARHTVVRFAEFVDLAGGGLTVAGTRKSGEGRVDSGQLSARLDKDQIVPVLAAEVTLLQARLDDLQRHVDRLVGDADQCDGE